jgi:subtilisin family serine protease
MSRKLTAIGLLTGVVTSGVVAVSAGTAAAAPVARTVQPDTVTLFTGDKVTLTGRDVTVTAARGREQTRFLQEIDERGDVHVIPEDTTAMLRARRLDPRLFNITQLVKTGYGDRNRKDVPLIVSGGPQLRAAKVRDLPSLGGAAVRVEKSAGLTDFAAADKIWLDGPVRASLDRSVPQIGAPEAWNAGFTGSGTTVAVLDTGIDATHPDLAGAVVKAENFSDSPNGADDYVGHGTHVASIVTGENARYRGVAPDTKLLNGKVLGDFGGGAESWIIAGMEWAAANGAQVINMSLGGSMPSDGTDPMSQAVNRITAETGALFVIAAGNSGGAPSGPGAADAALTVGAVGYDDKLAEFSSRGPRWLDDAIKPDITAPGVQIAAAKAAHGQIGTPEGDNHVRLSGTSMATPHVAGAAAILAQQHPDWHAGELKAALMGSARPNPVNSVFEQGSGRVDVAKSVQQNVFTVPASISAGVAQWPHNDDTPIKKTVTYHNSGTSPVTANLAADIKDPAGKPAPAGMFTFAPASVTIPAGGRTQVEITIDTRITAPDGLYSGLLTAGDLRTPIAVNREVESYDVTVKFVGNDGAPTSDYNARFVNIDQPKAYLPYDASGTTVVRLPKGRFYFNSTISGPDTMSIVTEPEYVVGGDATLVVDARQARPVGFTVDKPNARPGQAFVYFSRETSFEGGTGNGYFMPDFDGVLVRPSTTRSAPGQFTYIAETVLAEPDGKGGFAGSPYLYHLSQQVDREVPAQLTSHPKDNQLAKVRSEHGATAAGRFGVRDGVVVRALPFTLDEYYTPDTEWQSSFKQLRTPDLFGEADSYEQSTLARSFKRGTSTEKWNFGVFGPAFGDDGENGTNHAARLGDEVAFDIGLATGVGANRYGITNDTGFTTLAKDGKQIGREEISGYGYFPVPAGPGTYRLHTESVTDLTVSGKVVADWTFKSATTAEETALPLLAVRFAPALDAQARAPRVLPTLVPVTVEHNTDGKVKSLNVQVSHDDGKAWKSVPVLTLGGRSFVLISHPAGAKAVSLRASATDTAGNAVEQTIVRAFLLK